MAQNQLIKRSSVDYFWRGLRAAFRPASNDTPIGKSDDCMEV